MYHMKDFNLLKKMQKKIFSDAFTSDRCRWIEIRPLPPPVRPIRTNGNQLHLRSFVGMHSAVLIPPGSNPRRGGTDV